ncbi:hypothetical protein Q8A67_020343 [Cirrhinus molitorella]|uniref:Uncharacterized protein n=1 Tax=Cirrhinus molitorella TaxID=172907 RepID=A0AA88TNK8_9TELE|nr:hypothetical protein Q8A67_020343 [Cirrhinus molitorella]
MFSLPLLSANETTVCFGSCHEQSNNSPLRGRLLQGGQRPAVTGLSSGRRVRSSPFHLTPHAVTIADGVSRERRKSKNVELEKTRLRECLPINDDEGLDHSHSSTLNSCTDQLSLVFIFSSPTGRWKAEVRSCRQLLRCQIHLSGSTYLVLFFKSSQSRGRRHSRPNNTDRC